MSMFKVDEAFISCSRTDWPSNIIVESEGKKYRYRPRSYFYVSVDGLVHLIVEVQSERRESDRYRMLLQAACAARLGHMCYDEPFIVMALYIENTGKVTQYLVFQRDDNRKVCAFESKQSRVFSLLLGFLCLKRPKVDRTV